MLNASRAHLFPKHTDLLTIAAAPRNLETSLAFSSTVTQASGAVQVILFHGPKYLNNR
jgi:hypothetical protein